MNTLIEQIIEAGYVGRVFTDKQLANLVQGSNARRYGLVNRALKDGSLLRIKRGLYTLGSRHGGEGVHSFVIASAMVPGSYISLEAALSHHGWIPEAVYTIASITPERKSLTYSHDQFGPFTYHPLALHRYQFLNQISRVQFGKQAVFLANPLRALMDLVAFRKERWSGLSWIEEGLRIDREHLSRLRLKDFEALRGVYKHQGVNEFLMEFEKAVRDIKKRSHNPHERKVRQ